MNKIIKTTYQDVMDFESKRMAIMVDERIYYSTILNVEIDWSIRSMEMLMCVEEQFPEIYESLGEVWYGGS